MAQPPRMPQRYSSLLPADRHSLLASKTRKVSAQSTLSGISNTSTVIEFIKAKTEAIEAGVEHDINLRKILNSARKRKRLTDEDYNDYIEEAESAEAVAAKRTEYVILKRQKRILEEEMLDIADLYPTLEAAYCQILTRKVLSASKSNASAEKKKGKCDQALFGQKVLAYYKAKQDDGAGSYKKYCHLTGWHFGGTKAQVVCAHLVPKSLECEALAYLFGDGDAMLYDARNGITLYKVIESALDNGDIVFIPDKPEPNKPYVWRCILLNEEMRNSHVNNDHKWNDLDGKALAFLSENQPARRYLYFRYVITCIHHRNKSVQDWKRPKNAPEKLWAIPGLYLRASMLRFLAKQIGDDVLPESFLANTFDDTEDTSSRNADEEKVLGISLFTKLEQILANSSHDEAEKEAEEEEEIEEDEDDDEVQTFLL